MPRKISDIKKVLLKQRVKFDKLAFLHIASSGYENYSLPLMIPFASYLRALRQRHGLRQDEFAALLGYEQSYISALEIGTRGPPPEEFFRKLVLALSLDQLEEEELGEVRRQSQRRFTLPHEASAEIFIMFNDLWENLDRIHPAQVRMIQEILRMPAVMAERSKAEPARIRRKAKEEAKM